MEHLKTFNERDFNWSLDPKSLRDIYKQTNFDSAFAKLIANDVIKILSPQEVPEPHNVVYDEELIYQNLIAPLERFICELEQDASFADIERTLEHIQTLNEPSKLCRRILKAGDVTFSCNDCGLDGTCVVCIDCFHKSAHKDHNYRMSNSDGGGCCDCGDIEAWKQHYACSDHTNPNQVNLALADFEDTQLRSKQIESDKRSILEKIDRLPERVASKYFLVCQASLHYARLLLSWNNNHSLPEYLETVDVNTPTLMQLLSKDSSSKNYFTVLFNDEVHTYDHVINSLVKIIGCTKMTASIMASTISREGRSFVVNDNYKICSQVKDKISNVRDGGQGPLKVEVIHGTILAHQAFALKLIEWVQKMSSLCDGFRVLTAYTLLGSYDVTQGSDESSSDITLLEKIMLSNTSFWRIARVEWNDLFVTTLLKEYSIKEQFARFITRIYPKLMQDFIQDDHDHSVSILIMTTQLYTVPSLICMLIEEENALSIIMQTLIDTCRSTKRENPAMSFENRNTFDMQGLKRGFYIIADMKHLINIQPTKWTEQMRKNVIEAVRIFLNLLNSMQGMDSVKRQLGQHLEYEPDWESGMTLQSRLVTFITRLVSYCSFDEGVLVATLRETQLRLLKNGGYKMISRELFGHNVSCIQYDVSTSPVSVHLPLTRFAAALIVELMRLRPSDKVPYDESLVILSGEHVHNQQKHSMVDIMEPSLRTEVMIAQFRSGMWRRNGYSLVNQILYFHGASMRKEMFDRDILVLQECAAMCDANEFMIHLLNKFQLFTWISSETTREPLVGPKAVSFLNDEEIMAQTMSLGEEFLQLMLTIINERYRIGISDVQQDDVIRNEIIQLLCISPSTRSDLTNNLYVHDHELDCIKAVANLKRSTEASTGKYELKDEFYDRFNPFFYHYSRRQQSNALDAQLKRKKILKETLICCPPPAPIQLTDQFKNLNDLLKCDITLILIQKILRRALGPSDDVQECSTKAPIRFMASDLQLDQSLHLIGLGLYEQERTPLEFEFLQAAHGKDIFNLLRECYDKAKRSKDLIFWLMKKTSDLVEKLEMSLSDSLDERTVKVINSIKQSFKSVLSTSDDAKQDTKKRNSELAAQRRERIMAMMKASQAKFLSNPTTKQLVAETEKNERPSPTPAHSGSTISPSININQQPPTSSSQATNLPIYTTRSVRKTKPPKTVTGIATRITQRLVNNQETSGEHSDEPMDYESADCEDDLMDREPSGSPEPIHLCILCRDEQRIDFDQPTMILLAFIQRSAVLSQNRRERRIPNYSLTPTNQLKYQHLTQTRSKSSGSPEMYSFTSDNSWSFDATFMPSDLLFGPHISTCGHVMHYDCWQGFFDAVHKRETGRPNRASRHVSFDLEKYEILCPLCECISNATIPLLPNYMKFAKRPDQSVGTIFSTPREIIDRSSENLSACLHALRGTVDMFKHIRHIKEVSTNILITLEDKYIRLLQPKNINDVLEELDEIDALGLRDFINSIRSDKVTSNLCTKSLLGSISTLAERIHTVGLDLDRSITDVNHARIFMMTSWSISYTIQAFERMARFKGSPLLEDLESSKNLCLSALLRFACSSMMTHQSDMMQSLLVRKLRYLLINDEHLSSSPCCLDIDVFETFVSVTILLQKLYAHIDDSSQLNSGKPTSEQLSTSPGSISTSSKASDSSGQGYAWTTRTFEHEYFRNFLHLMLMLNSLQVIITLQNELTDSSKSSTGGEKVPDNNAEARIDGASAACYVDGTHSSSKECSVMYNFYKETIIASGHPNNQMPVVDEAFVAKIKNRLLPFLRSCTVFFFHLSQVNPPETLRKKSAFFEGLDFVNVPSSGESKFVDPQENRNQSEPSDRSAANLVATTEEFEAICQYLDLPKTCDLLFQSQESRNLARSWLHHSRVLVLIKSALKERAHLAAVAVAKLAQTAPAGSSSCNKMIKRVSSSSCLPPGASNANTSTGSSQQQQVSHQSATTSQKQETHQQISKTELMPVKFIRQPHLVDRLIELPYDYSELVDKVSDFTCPSVKNEDSRTPTMCLVCGIMLCSQSYCCQRDLNELASNYQQIVQRQQEDRSSLGEGSGQRRSSGGGSSGNWLGGGRGHGYLGGVNAAAALNLVHSAAAMMVSSTGRGAHGVGSSWADASSAAAAAASAASMSSASGNDPAPVIHQQLVGSCTYHAYECSGGVGIFLRIRNCQILLLSGRSKGCYMPAPYIDDHGETDFGLMRGNPLHLNRQHYERLQQMWLAHAIPEQISRTLEYSPYASSINWHLH